MDAALPGADLVTQGLEDLRNERVTVESLLVSIGAPRRRLVSFERALSRPIGQRNHIEGS